MEAMDKAKLGLATTSMADSPAKRRMATVLAGQAVVAALTPGMPQLEAVSIFPRGNVPARLDFKPQARCPLPSGCICICLLNAC